MKLKIYKIIFMILIIAAMIIIGLLAKRYYTNYSNDKDNEKIVNDFFNSSSIVNETDGTVMEKDITMNGYKVIGIISIPKINIQYPILDVEVSKPEDTKEPMKFSIVKYWGQKVNDYGNLSVAGHNYYDGTMFGKTRKLEIGDIIELTDLTDRTIKYEIFEKFNTDPNDVTILKTTDETIREVTLITCTNGNKERLILKAKEIEENKEVKE